MDKVNIADLTEEQISFQLILHSGSARSKVIQALSEYRNENTEGADDLIKQAKQDLRAAHDIHFQMVKNEAGGNPTPLSLLLMHAEDHLMSTVTMKDLVQELLELFKSRNL
ncbi:MULTISPECIES: PTS lactose/cellobiose transporter subunit IIA [unclassified Paenibacillus]|uniref:PTS lactose/cellobiose transporter subunit IIA n=1 Tax=unclassified Paenibacillus TaxID=185978 RepID=UPI0024BA4E01|nr:MULTISPECIES: PTS lactose/cellobiose transporter subunit IIA [unclassified Paenibacillus]